VVWVGCVGEFGGWVAVCGEVNVALLGCVW